MRHVAVFALAIIALTTGCAGRDIALSQEDRTRLSSIHLQIEEGEVTYSGKLPLQYETDNGNGLLANMYTMPIGIAYEIYRYPKTLDRKGQTMRAIFDDCEISVPDIVAARFAAAVGKKPPFVEFVDGDSEADARLRLVVSYGVSGLSMMHDAYVPWLEITGELISETDERVMWRKTLDIDPDEPPMRELPFPDPFENPRSIRKMYAKAARKICHDLVKDLYANP